MSAETSPRSTGRAQAREIHNTARAFAAAFAEAGWTWGANDGEIPDPTAIEDRIYRSLERIANGEVAAGWTTSSGRIALTVDEDGDVRIALHAGSVEGVASRAALERAERTLTTELEPAVTRAMSTSRPKGRTMPELPAIKTVLSAYRSIETHITEEQITAAWAEFDGLAERDDPVVAKLATLAERQRRTLESLGEIAAGLRRERDALRSLVVVCDCASTPPTMPTCRDEHLPSCPVAKYLAALDDHGTPAEGQEDGPA